MGRQTKVAKRMRNYRITQLARLGNNAASRIDWGNSWNRTDQPPSSDVILVIINYPQH